MAIDLSMCRFTGPAFPEPFVRFELEKELKELLPKITGDAGRELAASWDVYRRQLRELVSQGGPIRVRNMVIEPLAKRLGYDRLEEAPDVTTREGSEDGGNLLLNQSGRLRIWTTSMAEDLDAPSRRGHAYRFSHLRVAQRVLLATNERVGLLTNGVELRILISDPARMDSQIEIPVESQWKRSRDLPDSYRLVLALCSPAGIKAIPELIEKARLKQTGVTRELRKQAREAVELFVQDLLDHPQNRALLAEYPEKRELAKKLWYEGLINIFRILFILKMESVDDPARAFSFASTSLWRNTFSPSVALAPVTRNLIDHGMQTGSFLEHGLRSLYRMFTKGLACTEINVKPLGGALFGENATPLLSKLYWGELAVAHLLDRLLWTPKTRGSIARGRVYYGPLTVGDLGRVYESLIELEPGITTKIMCRLRRRKLEVVVPVEQGEKYRPKDILAAENAEETEPEEEAEEEEETGRGKKTKIEWIEEIPANRFYLRMGLGRKATGSYYTPDSFVKFLVQETLDPLCEERSPKNEPQPSCLLKLKIADNAMGSGHFLFEACEFLGEKLYEACRLCDELAMAEEAKAERAKAEDEKKAHLVKADEYRQRVHGLPDPNAEIMAYLPSRAPEDGLTAYSVSKARAICKRLVAVHCLYGVDLNPLAVELAKLSLWIETHAEGLPLTFLDHRFIVGDSLTGPFFDQFLKYPGSQMPMDDLFTQGLKEKFTGALQMAMRQVNELEATVGINLGEIEAKKAAKARMDELLKPFRLVAAAWAGGVLLGPPSCDDQAYAQFLKAVTENHDPEVFVTLHPRVATMVDRGRNALPFNLVFPEIFFREADMGWGGGFDVVLGNPPWNKMNLEEPSYLGSYDLRFLEAGTSSKRKVLEKEFEGTPIWNNWTAANHEEDMYCGALQRLHPLLASQGEGFGQGNVDIFAAFIARSDFWLKDGGRFGMVIPSAFHVSMSLTNLRKTILAQWTLQTYFCFINARRLFDIHGSWKYTPMVMQKAIPPANHSFKAQFYLDDDRWLGFPLRDPEPFDYPVDLIFRLDEENAVIQEFRSHLAIEIAKVLFRNSTPLSRYATQNHIQLRRELHATDDRWRIDYSTAPRTWQECFSQGLVHHQPGTIHQFTDLWQGAQTALVPYEKLRDKKTILRLAQFYRAAYRVQARADDERTGIFAVLPPGTTATNSLQIEGMPEERCNSVMLGTVAVCNSFVFDWALRLRVGSKTVSKFLMEGTPITRVAATLPLLAHSSVRLVGNHAGFFHLWTEQLYDAWREPKAKHTWPVLEDDDSRWTLRAAVDAVIADVYGLTCEQYEQVLSMFSHKSYPKAPSLCLARFDELKSIGLEAFTKKHDPYWDIPLNDNLPKPVIELPVIKEEENVIREEGSSYFVDRSGQTSFLPPDYGPLFGGAKKKTAAKRSNRRPRQK